MSLYNEDCLSGLYRVQTGSVAATITSPPYNKKGLMGAKNSNQIWKKHNIDYDSYGDDMKESDYVLWQKLVLGEIFRVTKEGGSLFYNHKMRRHNNKCFAPWVLFDDTPWSLYQLIILNRKNSPNIRSDILVPCTEYIFWQTNGKPMVHRERLPREFRSEVWVIPPKKQENHPAPFHPLIPELCINLATEPGDIVLDPFMGVGTVPAIAKSLGRNYIGFEISTNYFTTATEAVK